MKKLMIFALGVAAVLASCVKNEVEDISKPEEIAFKEFTISEGTRADDNLAFEPDHFWAYAQFSNAGDGTNYKDFWGDAAKEIKKKAGSEKWAAVDGPYYWPKAGKLSFWGFYHAGDDATLGGKVTFNADKGVKYTGVTDVETEHILVADPEKSRLLDKNDVPMIFRHAGAQVIFRFANASKAQGYTLTIKDVTITEAVKEGDFIYSAWAFDVADKKGNYPSDPSDPSDPNNTPHSVVVDNVDDAENAYTFKVIPQTLVQSGIEKQIIINYHVDVDNSTVKYSYDGQYTAAATAWNINTIHYYNITFNFTSAEEEILFAPEVEEWLTEKHNINVNN